MAIWKRKVNTGISDVVRGIKSTPVGREGRVAKGVGMIPPDRKGKTKKNLWGFLRKDDGNLAATWVSVVFIFFALQLIYMSFYRLIAITLYDMVLYYVPPGGVIPAVEIANNVVTFFKIFPVCFMFSVIIWAVSRSFVRASDLPLIERY